MTDDRWPNTTYATTFTSSKHHRSPIYVSVYVPIYDPAYFPIYVSAYATTFTAFMCTKVLGENFAKYRNFKILSAFKGAII